MINSSNIYTILVNEGGKDLPLLDQIKDKKNPAEILYSVYRDVNRQVEKRTYAALGRSLALMEKCYMLGDRNVRTSLELIFASCEETLTFRRSTIHAPLLFLKNAGHIKSAMKNSRRKIS